MRGDDHPLDLVSAFVDGGDLGVAVGPFHLHALEGDDLALLHNLAADGADFVAGVAILGAGGLLSTHQLDLVTQSGDDLAFLHGLAADGADFV